MRFLRMPADFCSFMFAFVVIRELCHLSGQQTACGLNFFLDQPH